jgi:hypothetical protein
MTTNELAIPRMVDDDAPDPAADTSIVAALAPVRKALLRQARAEAAQVHADAEHDAQQLVTEAQASADAVLTAARARGQAEASVVVAQQRARARREARAAELAVQRQAYEQLRQEVVARMRRLRDQPDYPALQQRLTAYIRATLGDEAVITEAPSGGVVGRAPGRSVDCSLDALAQRALDLLGAEVSGLWQP